MRRRLTELLACPKCRFSLTLEVHAEESDEILEGSLSCSNCTATYPVQKGIPRFLVSSWTEREARTMDRFGAQWTKYSWLSPEYEQQFLDWISPVPPVFFKGKTVLDAGCGKGRHLAFTSRYGARDIVGIDASRAVEAAYGNLRDQPHVHIVQGDLRYPPLKQVFDYVYSVGVLHHLPEPRCGFDALVPLIKPGGQITVWVYGLENNHFVNTIVKISRNTIGRLPAALAHVLIWPASLLIYLLAKGVYGPMSRKAPAATARLFYNKYFVYISRFNIREIHLIVVDHLLPSIAHYIPRLEFERWFQENHLADVQIGWHNENSWRGHGVKAAETTFRYF
jgi:SAM-dependent methyltransferase